MALSSGSLWASRLASITGVHISNAWRTLEQAEELGLLVPVSSARRSRGDARVYAALPIARAAGLLVAPVAAGQGSASAAEEPHELAQALADTDEALAELERLLARTGG